MPVSLLDSQLAALQPPGIDEALKLDVDMPLEAMAGAPLDYLKGLQQ